MIHFLEVVFPWAFLLLTVSTRAQAEDLNIQMMKATVKLTNEKTTATAFILSRLAPDDPHKVQFFLVTAGHVFENLTGDQATVFFRHKESEGTYKKVPFKLTIRKEGKALWTKHPTADVAVMSLTPPAEAEMARLPLDILATDETLKKYQIHPGDNLVALGYPHRVEASEGGFPILRNGSIASYPLTPAQVNRTFLLCINTFEGDSGGPVYMVESNRVVEGKKQTEEVRLIVGLVAGQLFLDEEAKMIYGTTKVRHRLGLAIVVPAVFVRETIDRVPRNP